jgi:hypothetical protein
MLNHSQLIESTFGQPELFIEVSGKVAGILNIEITLQEILPDFGFQADSSIL